MTIELSALQQQRRDTAANWTGQNPTLLTGEIGYETDTGKFKIGDGSTAWTSLGYLPIPDNNGLIPIDQLLLPAGTAAAPSLTFTGDVNTGIYSPGADQVAVATNGTGRLFIDGSGNVGIGNNTSGFASNLIVGSGSGDNGATIYAGTSSQSYLHFADGTSGADRYRGGIVYNHSNNSFAFATNDNTAITIDSSQRLLVGTSSARTNYSNSSAYGPLLNLEGTSNSNRVLSFIHNDSSGGPLLVLGSTGGSTAGSNDLVAAQSTLGFLSWQGADGSELVEAANIKAQVDGTPGANDMPGRLVFSTTADGASSPTERMTIDNTGKTKFTPSSSLATFEIQQGTTNSDSIRLQGGGTVNTYLETRGYLGHVFFVNTDEKMRLDSSGRLLVGTSNSIAFAGIPPALQVQGNTDPTARISIRRIANDSSPGVFLFAKTRSSGHVALQDDDTIGQIEWYGADGTDTNQRAALIKAEVDGTPGNNDMPGRLVFSTTADGATSPTERMRIAQDGRHFTFSPGALTHRSPNGANSSDALFVGIYSGTSTTSGGTASFYVRTNGNVENTNNSYGAISDIKLKENIVDASSQWADLKALRVVNYNFKPETGAETHKQLGLIAQEVELVSPGLVSESPDRDAEGNDLGTVTKSVNYSVLYMKAVKALQEAMERIEQLEAKVAALEAQ